MKNVLVAFAIFLFIGLSAQASAAQKSPDIIQKPTAEQVLRYTNALEKNPSADRKVATEALQKWMDGKLSTQQARKYKSALNLGIQKESIDTKNAEACAVCVGACCFWWGCEPSCVLLCKETVCK